MLLTDLDAMSPGLPSAVEAENEMTSDAHHIGVTKEAVEQIKTDIHMCVNETLFKQIHEIEQVLNSTVQVQLVLNDITSTTFKQKCRIIVIFKAR